MPTFDKPARVPFGFECIGQFRHERHSSAPLDDFFRTLGLGRFAGPIFAIILLVDCLFFAFLEWWIPRESIDKVEIHWNQQRFAEVRLYCDPKSVTATDHRAAIDSSPRNIQGVRRFRRSLDVLCIPTTLHSETRIDVVQTAALYHVPSIF